MSDEQSPTTPAVGSEGSAPWAQGTTESSPTPQSGPAVAPQSQDQGQAQSTPATDDPSFFDPNNVPPELLPAYKQMQAAFTTKTQDLSRIRKENEAKIQAYDQYARDPITTMQNMAAQYGLQLTRAQAAQQIQQQAQQQQQDWEPQTWQEVRDRIRQETLAEARQSIMQELAPYLGHVQTMQAQNVEQQLTKIDPEWRQYEGQMRQRLQEHPTLVNDVSLLYRMSVPPEAMEAKAIQQALKKFDDKAKGVGITPTATGPRSKPASPQIKTFEDAVNLARQQLNRGE